MRNQRKLTEHEKKELKILNKSVAGAIKERKEWLDNKACEISKFDLYDELYNPEDGKKLGSLSKIYRYQYQDYERFKDIYPICEYVYIDENGEEYYSSAKLNFKCCKKEEI